MPRAMLRVAAILSLAGILLVPANAVAHGHAHHELAHGASQFQDDGASGIPEITEAEHPAGHPHPVASPLVAQRLQTTPPAARSVAVTVEWATRLLEVSATRFSLQARPPPGRVAPNDSRPRSPPPDA
ncbi:MAG: hypothetical protein WKF55_13815 [Gemmatimonadaceae bacterium]